MNPEFTKGPKIENLDGDQDIIIKFMKGPLFTLIIDKAVERQTDNLLRKVNKLEEDIRMLTGFNVDVIKLLCTEKEVAKEKIHKTKSDMETKRHKQHGAPHLEKSDLKAVDVNFYQTFIKRCHDEKRKPHVKMGSNASLDETEEQKLKSKIVPVNEIKRFVMDCLVKLGVQNEKAKVFTNGLVSSDNKGNACHGINRLESFIIDIKEKNCNANADPTITLETESTAVVSGNNGLGYVVGMFCMNLAIKKAAKTGIAMVVANNSNQFGCNSFYTEYAVEHGFIGLAFTNTSPAMVPTGAKQVCYGTNPMSIAAPAEFSDKVVVDFATTAAAVGKIELAKMNLQRIPLGWALDENCNPTTDPAVALKVNKLLPLGGDNSHKGTCLALMVEILSGLLAGSAYGPNIKKMGSKDQKPANLGHGFIAIDPKKFAPGFEKRLSDLIGYVRNLEPIDSKKPVLVPGDPERNIAKEIEDQGGIEYADAQLKLCDKLVKEMGIKPLRYALTKTK